MKRRSFIGLMAGLSAAAVYGNRNPVHASNQVKENKMYTPGPPASVAVTGISKGSNPEVLKTAIRDAVEATTDFSWLSKGDTVFIKPALNSGKPFPATTNPIAIAAMIQLLKEKGAGRVIVGDMSGIEHVKLSENGLSGSTRALMESSGMARAVKEAGGETHFFDEAGWSAFYEDEPVAGSNWKHGLMMPNALKDVQHIVLMPRCGRHILAGATLGLKNAVGYWRTDTRLEYHADASTFHEKTAEGNTVPTLKDKQRLTVTAADKILTTIGPDQGFVFEPDTGLVIASESVVAHEMVSLAWLLESRKHIPSSDENGFIDNSPLAAALANRWVVKLLDSWGTAFSAEGLEKNRLETIWDDRVLNRAYEVFGGVPKVTLTAANTGAPEALVKQLSQMTTRSA